MNRLLIIAAILLWSNLTYSQTYSTENAHAEVKGQAPGKPYTGVSDELKGTYNTKTGEVEFSLTLETLKTDKKLRDKHMYEALETSEHPKATFKGKVDKDFDPKGKGEQKINLQGTFTIHGESKEVKIPGTLTANGDDIKFYAEWPIDITEYGIEPPQFLSIKVEPEHTISVSGNISPQK